MFNHYAACIWCCTHDIVHLTMIWLCSHFDTSQCEVVAILDWKVDENADPLADVAYFMMVFLQPGDYGYRYKQLPKLLLGEWKSTHMYMYNTHVIYCMIAQVHICTNVLTLYVTIHNNSCKTAWVCVYMHNSVEFLFRSSFEFQCGYVEYSSTIYVASGGFMYGRNIMHLTSTDWIDQMIDHTVNMYRSANMYNNLSITYAILCSVITQLYLRILIKCMYDL